MGKARYRKISSIGSIDSRVPWLFYLGRYTSGVVVTLSQEDRLQG